MTHVTQNTHERASPMADIYERTGNELKHVARPQHPTPSELDMQKTGPWILAATILGSGMVFIDTSAVNVALPRLQTDLNASTTSVQWVVVAYVLFLAALMLVGGSLGDRFGRRRIFASGVILFALASMWCGLSP